MGKLEESGLMVNGINLNGMEKDLVNHPPHYNQAGIECIDAIRAATDSGFEYYLQGNILKYIWRFASGIHFLKHHC